MPQLMLYRRAVMRAPDSWPTHSQSIDHWLLAQLTRVLCSSYICICTQPCYCIAPSAVLTSPTRTHLHFLLAIEIHFIVSNSGSTGVRVRSDVELWVAGRRLSRARLGVRCSLPGLDCVPIRLRPDPVGAHHLVVLVLDDVAVPHVQAGEVELGLDPGDLLRVGDDGVLVAGLPALRRSGRSLGRLERLAVDDLELHLVDVDGVGVFGEVVELPDLGGSQRRVLGDRIVPAQVDRVLAGPSGVKVGNLSWLGGTLVSLEASGTTVNFMTWPVVAGSAASNSCPGSPPPNGSSGPSLIRYSWVPTGMPVKSTITSARSARPISS